MKTIRIFGICAAALLCCTACAEQSSTAPESSSTETADGVTVTLADGVDARYGETLKKYFDAINDQDYDAYLATVYPPYAERYGAYLASKGRTMQQAFESMCSQFDEDGYESWALTAVEAGYFKYETEYVQSDGIADYFSSYTKMGVLDEGFEQKCRDAAEDIRDVKFTLYALYSGDEEPVAVVSGQEILMLIDADGCWLFG